uniref:Antitoxin n=1 Tax=Candidatus Kentrum sp. FM TaxID=2126340 RepID=A0A450TY23_9GAMM|nr:MAG: hypothetical protein BECKFM1743C_GA0114222_107882 [Candidatus Kentron sp. FM]VFJ74839.1 MAG: hypothetical protein BECKFM1743A_GA0114220_108002 [Candidatus Kentron sp. FM]VFK08385.1 MAG: hypothetical protein BECKFM1743B_GA0114221_100681 [Candidatus Kentron sp. FM]
MHSKLTLRMDDSLIQQAKDQAARRGKSVSQMFGEFVSLLSTSSKREYDIPPITASLLGIIENHPQASEEAYKKHLREKYL